MELSDAEVRVLGALIEKEATTPDQYPLSTNALTTACNQKTSRDPVVAYDQRLVAETMLLLRPAGLARTMRSGRTEKHRHVLDEALGLDRAELAVLSVLMLRGPQTPGELRTRTERAHRFESVDEVDAVLSGLTERDEPLVRCLGRGPGQSQDRWTHLLGGLDPRPESDDGTEPEADVASAESTRGGSSETPSSMKRLEERVAELERRIAAIEAEFGL
jgi:uncharacterized protein YceH (UPF0502 family)